MIFTNELSCAHGNKLHRKATNLTKPGKRSGKLALVLENVDVTRARADGIESESEYESESESQHRWSV